MTHYAVVTPTMGAAGAHFFAAPRMGDGVAPFPAMPELPMAVRLFPWPEAWDGLLPEGMEIYLSGTLRMARGWLLPSVLERWQERIFQTVAQDSAMALHQSLRNLNTPRAAMSYLDAQGKRRKLAGDRPLIMGIVNVTPDSFSDGGHYHDTGRAVAHAMALVEQGADLLDIGGESTRPGAAMVPVDEELRRVVPVVRAIAAQTKVPISVDTAKGRVMEAALEAGAALINDVTALKGDPLSLRVLRDAHCPVVLMHKKGTPRNMQNSPHYEDVVAEVYGFLGDRMQWCVENGIGRERLVIDPGIGFGKTHGHNLELLAHIGAFTGLAAPLLLGISRKRIVGHLTGCEDAAQRDVGSHLMAALGVQRGANWVRVHDVAGMQQALRCLV
ncbi:Dihydropteroate synthase [Magnetococcus marinus MC-1]|uniref:Dihydropteroate synthase n=1 Tax=Magnetococcus marinus (strain ATCC BAA-1437 / JCM 17883 / MC-1) TaxID=156889 RepID=A0L4S1_MAGMM|nr:dihydropteroate synthase [Magnetococcus marinus]ABK42964.1 Dihydropteroate synthase [Magnetococcus marinus MC-1]